MSDHKRTVPICQLIPDIMKGTSLHWSELSEVVAHFGIDLVGV